MTFLSYRVMRNAWVALSIVCILMSHAHGWQVLSSTSCSHQRVNDNVSSSSIVRTSTTAREKLFELAATRCDALDGVSEFEEWIQGLDKDLYHHESIQHHAFGSLRGLKCQEENTEGNVISIPKSVVLSSNYADEDWDSQLAVKLWRECLKGRQSHIYGYCTLLAQGQKFDENAVPPSTAPNALRHWTAEELETLSQSARGKKLMMEHTRQESQWKAKYQAITDDMTWEQFEWCMEVVHSRAFRGNYALSSFRSIGAALPPLLSALIGLTYMQGNADIQDSVLMGLAAFAVLPISINILIPDKGEVVLLPFIDSANHLEDADSEIRFDPLKGVFSLSVGPKCIVRENAGIQLYISYGPKSDGELLLNHGFMPDVPFPDVTTESSRSAYRRNLIEKFSQRVPR